ncbi:hypothetical protein [Sphingomonas sp. dw_22]|uniref:hypothetical protein n=1 Tax=Sphingomonas sp. dw_22 TaxID=2721175 RepID=UPI001BD572F2|nr:hypothetical protein [Sphingomonas sp. dw_22]
MNSPSPAFDQYLQAAEHVREAIRQNRADQIDGEAQEIVYIFDTNVIEHFLQIGEGGGLGGLTFGELLRDSVAVRVGHRLTTEYLLSGGLPGQNNGKSKGNGYISPFHWNETLARVGKLERQVVRTAEAIKIDPLDDLQAIEDPRELLKKASLVVPREILAVLKRATSVERRLDRCFGQRRAIVPFQGMTFWANAESKVLHRDLARWRTSLLLHRRKLDANRKRHAPISNRSEQDLRHRIEHDAATLAGIEALYRCNPEACGESRRLQFLFITADQAILDAVSERRDALEEQGIPLFIRHPRVYSPLLNFSNMLSTLQGVEIEDDVRTVFLAVERAVEQLFELDQAPSPSAVEDGSEKPKESTGPLFSQWAEAARRLVTVNSRYFSEDSESIQRVAERLTQPDALKTASQMLGETLSRIRGHHSRILSMQALDQLSRNLTDLAEGRAQKGLRRAPMIYLGPHLTPSRSNLEASRGIDQLLDRLVTDGGLPEIREVIEQLGPLIQGAWTKPEGQLLAACIFLAVGAWTSALECAQRCIEQSTGRAHAVFVREANYTKALALRFAIRSRSDFDDAKEVLSANIVQWGFRRDHAAPLSSLRDTVELAALYQSVAVLQAIENSTPYSAFGPGEVPLDILQADEIISYFDKGVSMMESALETLDLNFSGDSAHGYAAGQIDRQLSVNLVGAYVFKKLFGPLISADAYSDNGLDAMMKRVLELMSDELRTVPPIARVYANCGRVLMSPNVEEAQTTISLVDSVLADLQLPYADQVELRYLRDFMLVPMSSDT